MAQTGANSTNRQKEMETMKLYKLTNARGYTREEHLNCLQWGKGIIYEAAGAAGQPLCTSGLMHCYLHKLVAVLCDCLDGNYGPDGRLWKCTGEGEFLSDGLQGGFRKLTSLEEVPLPKITMEERVHWGILCAIEVFDEELFSNWAKGWVSANRQENGAMQVVRTLGAYGYSHPKYKASLAGYYAARAAAKAAGANADWDAFAGMEAGELAANAATAAAEAAAVAGKDIDFGALAERAVEAEQLVETKSEDLCPQCGLTPYSCICFTPSDND